MRLATHIILSSLSLIILGGCANTFGGVDVHRVAPGMIAIAQPANVRSAYTDGKTVCAEPPPDAALQAVANAAAKVSTKAGASVDLSGGLTTSVVGLAGRTQTVLIARDAFTANCILMMNKFISTTDAETNFKATLDVIQTIAKADQTAAEADATKAKTEQAKVALAAAESSDPAVKAAVATMISTADDNVTVILKALSNGQGALQPMWVGQFFGQSDVKALLPNGVAELMAKQTDADALKSIIGDVYNQYAGALAAIAKNFKGT